MKKEFYSNGKLLITAEYVVLDGAQALALPTKFGQNLIVNNTETKTIQWTSYDDDGSIWFNDTLTFESIVNNSHNNGNKTVKDTLTEILHHAYLLNPEFIDNSQGFQISTHLTFPKFWGLGTSSTLINNIAQWLNIDAYNLLQKSFGGSGYDIACAQKNVPILYQILDGKPDIKKIDFKPQFFNNIFFVYLNKKQNSKSAIASYKENHHNISETIEKINAISNTILKTTNFDEFSLAVQNHEIAMSAILKIQPIKDLLFNDFNGSIKSLGAWGGDFVMAVSKENPINYFKSKGFETVISYEEMIL